MANPKPTELAEWASGPDAAIGEPLAGEVALGWVPGEPPQAPYLNKLHRLTWQWFKYVDTLEENDFTWTGAHIWTGAQEFQAAVQFGAAATFLSSATFKLGLDLTDESSPNLTHLQALITAARSTEAPVDPTQLRPLPLLRSGLIGLYHGIGNEGVDTLPGMLITFNAQCVGVDGGGHPVWEEIDTFQPAYRLSVLKAGLVIHRAEAGPGTITWTRVSALPAAAPPAFLRQDFAANGATPVSVTNHATHGFATIAAGQSVVVVNHPDVTVDSSIQLTIEGGTFDATLTRVQIFPGAGNFQIRGNANATGTVRVRWTVFLSP